MTARRRSPRRSTLGVGALTADGAAYHKAFGAPVGVPDPVAVSQPIADALVALMDPGARRYRFKVPPSANRYWRTDQETGLQYVSTEGKTYRQHVANAALLARGLNPIDRGTDVVVVVTWFRSRASGDTDNRLKVLLDALKGVAYQDDAQVAAVAIARSDADPDGARVDLVVAPILYTL